MQNDNYNWHDIDFDGKEEDIISSLKVPNTYKETKENIEYVESNLWLKLEKFGKKISFARDIKALYRYMLDSNVQWYRKSIVLAGLVYFISPIDAIPDIIPLIGYLDDLGVITAVIKFLGHELTEYYE